MLQDWGPVDWGKSAIGDSETNRRAQASWWHFNIMEGTPRLGRTKNENNLHDVSNTANRFITNDNHWVVYEVSVECGHVYVGQTTRCFNERERNIRNKAANFLFSRDLEKCCNWAPIWDACHLLGKEREVHKGLVLETMHILSAGNCISVPCLTFDKMLKHFLFVCMRGGSWHANTSPGSAPGLQAT